MLLLTHLVLAMVLIAVFKLDRNSAVAVLLLGVFIDVDHTFGLVQFLGQEGWRGILDINGALASDIQWKGLMHSQEAVFIVGPITAGYQLAMPLVAWAAHLLMDQVQIAYLGVMSGAELLLLLALLTALVPIELWKVRSDTPRAALRDLFRWEASRLVDWVGELPVLWRLRRKLTPRETAR